MGRPLHPDELGHHVRLGWSYQRAIPHWPFLVDGQRVAVDIGEVVRVNDGDVMRELALHGTGLARLSLYHAWADVLAGRLVPVLEEFNTGDLEPIRSEEHTSELQSQSNLVCRLLLEKKKKRQ